MPTLQQVQEEDMKNLVDRIVEASLKSNTMRNSGVAMAVQLEEFAKFKMTPEDDAALFNSAVSFE